MGVVSGEVCQHGARERVKSQLDCWNRSNQDLNWAQVWVVPFPVTELTIPVTIELDGLAHELSTTRADAFVIRGKARILNPHVCQIPREV